MYGHLTRVALNTGSARYTDRKDNQSEARPGFKDKYAIKDINAHTLKYFDVKFVFKVIRTKCMTKIESKISLMLCSFDHDKAQSLTSY